MRSAALLWNISDVIFMTDSVLVHIVCYEQLHNVTKTTAFCQRIDVMSL